MADAALKCPPLPPPLAGRAKGFLVGLSGGLDSMVLLHLLATAPPRPGLSLRAIHVHHGLHPEADAWAAHCEAACAAWSVPLQVVRVRVPRASGPGPEAAARAVRHAAFAGHLREDEVLVLAHHQDDQAETFLLRALRASGPDGLAAMRPWRAYPPGWLWRPLLDRPREALLVHARGHGLEWVEDPSNAEVEFDRNFLRARVMPLLRERWPHAAAALARSAALSAEGAALLREGDARLLDSVRGDSADVLDAGALQALPRERRARVLRLWIERLGLPPLPANGIAQVEAALLQAAADAEAEFAWSGARLRRWRQWLHAGAADAALPENLDIAWDGSAPLALPAGGVLRLEGAERFEAPLRVHARQGGERIRLPGRDHHHALKRVLQERGVPPWERQRLPLLSDPEGTLLAAGDQVLSGALEAWLAARGARVVWDRGDAVAACAAPAS